MIVFINFQEKWNSARDINHYWPSAHGLLMCSVVKNLPANAGDAGSILGLRRFPRGGNGNPLQYSCLGNPMDRGDWQATVHGVTKSWIWLSDWACMHIHNHRIHDGRSRGHQNLTKTSGWDAFSLFSFIFHLQMPLCSVMSDFLWPNELLSARLLCLWDFPGKKTGVGCHFLLQGIFSTQGLNPRFRHCRPILHCWVTGETHEGSNTVFLNSFLMPCPQHPAQGLAHWKHPINILWLNDWVNALLK